MREIDRRSRSGFTLVELLVVIAIIGVLVAMLLPAVNLAREASRRSSCANNVKQLGIALHTYHDTFRKFPFGWSDRGAGWTTMILPQIEQQPMYDSLGFNEADNWDTDNTNNERACCTFIQAFRCPSMSGRYFENNQGIPERMPCSYRGVASSTADADNPNESIVGRSMENIDLEGIFYTCSATKMADVIDGLSNTFMVGESYFESDFSQDGGVIDFWYIGSPQIDPCSCSTGAGGDEYSEFCGSTGVPFNARAIATTNGHYKELSFSSFHPKGAHFVLADASVKFVNFNVSGPVYKAAGSRSGNETPGGNF
jgi:prepilin-type N-terminal cleavage/methylation domain-containing protein